MTTVAEQQDTYLSHYAQLEKQLGGGNLSWLGKLRQQAIHRFAELGFPTTRHEDWKYTSVAPIARTPFQPAAPVQVDWPTLAVVPGVQVKDAARLVFVNGFYSAKLSSLDGLSDGVKVRSLAQFLTNGAGLLEDHLARYASFEDHPFVALNTAFIRDGAVVEISRGAVLENPIHLLFISAPGASPIVAHPRTFVLAGEGSQAALIESYVSVGEGTCFTNAVTEIVVGENAVVDHYRVQQEAPGAFHVATQQARLARNSTLNSHNFVFGGALVRNDVNASLEGEGGHGELNGLFVAGGNQHIDNHTRLEHVSHHCTSHELYKGILDGRASGVFNGAIVVRPDAQKTDSIQHNRNLLLSGDALINTKPQLEIFADDVKCTHGATIGQLDKEALFYLRSRGIGAHQARSLLIFAFANEIIEGCRIESLRDALHPMLSAVLSVPDTPREDA